MTVIVRERSGAQLTATQWERISTDPAFRDLVDRGILSAVPHRGRKGWLLKAGPYVGNVVLGGVPIRIDEKVPGSFHAMVSAIAPTASRIARALSPIAYNEQPDVILGKMLIAAARTYVSRDPEAVYRSELGSGGTMAGALDLRRTIALRARGLRHRVAYRRPLMTDSTPLNRTIYSALGELAAPDQTRALGHQITSAARSLRAWFGESADASRQLSRSTLMREAKDVASCVHGSIHRREAAALSFAVLSGASLTDFDRSDANAPRAWFVNLETVFERFLFEQIRIALPPFAKIGTSASWPDRARAPALFSELPNRYLSNPDVVAVVGEETLIFDAKYKDHGVMPQADEVYQLLAHAAACGSRRAALFYPSDGEHRALDLGTATTGCRVWAFSLDLRSPAESAFDALRAMGIVQGQDCPSSGFSAVPVPAPY